MRSEKIPVTSGSPICQLVSISEIRGHITYLPCSTFTTRFLYGETEIGVNASKLASCRQRQGICTECLNLLALVEPVINAIFAISLYLKNYCFIIDCHLD